MPKNTVCVPDNKVDKINTLWEYYISFPSDNCGFSFN